MANKINRSVLHCLIKKFVNHFSISLTLVFTFTTPALGGEQKEIVFRMQWVPQAQFAGYLVAEAKGFF